MVIDMILRAFKARNAAHIRHWKTDSYAQHQALGDFYEGLTDILDKYVESHQGTFGKVGDLPGDQKEIAKYLREELVWLNLNGEKIASNVPALENVLDEMAGMYMTTLYKLENLR